MKKISLFLVYIITFLYLEFLFKILLHISIFNLGLLSMIFFILSLSSILLVLTKAFPDKINKTIFFIVMLGLIIWITAQYVTKESTSFYFDLDFASTAGKNIMDEQFKDLTIKTIVKRIPQMLLFFIPWFAALIFNKKINFKKSKTSKLVVLILFIPIWILAHKGVLLIDKDGEYSPYKLVYAIRDNELSIEKLGVFNAFYLDSKRSIFGFTELLSLTNKPKKTDVPAEKVYDYNVLNIDLESFYKESKDSTINQMTQYFMNDTGTLQNEYTGIFKGKNLVYIMAESFNGIAVSKELTPTLYKMIHEGWDFTNFYNPTIASTIGGETQLLTGLYPAAYGPMQHNPSEFTMGLATMFKNVDYDTYAYHNSSPTFQGRNYYLAKMGFTNFKGCGNGLQKLMNCKYWPSSDIDMVDVTASDYINGEKPFLTYYVTVSGHNTLDEGIGWSFSAGQISKKYKSEVRAKYPNYPEALQAYIAGQMELDRALEKLVNLLEEAGKLEDTVFVLGGDHYPYALGNDVKSFITRTLDKDMTIGINHSNVIIWNKGIEHKEINKVMSTIDILPTVYNLFGIKYDSRLFVGKDVFAPGEGLAIFGNRSWVTDKGMYYTSNSKFIPNEGVTLDDESAYIKEMNAIVSDKINISKNLIVKGYYVKAWKYLK